MLVVTSTEIVTEEKEATCVEAYAVLVRVRLIEKGASVIPSPYVVKRRDPFLFAINYVEPNACDKVNVHQQEEYQFDKFN